MYEIMVRCQNCGWEGEVRIAEAVPISNHCCPTCDCKTLARRYSAVGARKLEPGEALTGMGRLLLMQKQLMEQVPHGVSELTARRMVAGLGIIEETIEYLNSTGHKPWRPQPLSEEDQLEEIVDILFFYLEEVVMSGFSWEQIEAKYHEKHAINLDRYERARKGDTTWDKRGKKEGL